MGLSAYKRKRDFDATAEPEGVVRRRRGGARFVVQEHHASHLHFDFRLEIDGVLKSWSIPKGPSMSPGDRRLAVEVEDHPLEYAGFSGEIPAGHYGAGQVYIWDEGTFEIEAGRDAHADYVRGQLAFTMHGGKLAGAFALVRMPARSRSSKPSWLLIKKADAHARADWHLSLVGPGAPPRAAAARRATHAARRDTPRTATRRAAEETVTGETFLRRKRREGEMGVRLGRTVVAASNLEKLYWPDDGYTKADLIAYYLRVGAYIMPHLAQRPAILMRFPNGIGGKSFVQHDVTAAPAAVKTVRLTSETGRALDYAVYTDLASLVALVNLGTITQHVWHSRLDRLDRPDYVVFDLDPHGAPFAHVLELTLATRRALREQGLESYAKTSGSSGMHVYVPLQRVHEYEAVARFAEQIAARVAERHPKIATVERRLAERRRDQVYVDWQQNARGKSAASVYSVRARPGATVSAPVTWAEVERGIALTDFTIATMPARLTKLGDLWAEVRSHRQRLRKR